LFSLTIDFYYAFLLYLYYKNKGDFIMKKLKNWFTKIFSDKKTINHHQDHTSKANLKNDMNEQWTKRMDSTHNKMSEGASEFTRAIRSRGGSNSKISGKEHDQNHKEANNMHKLNKKK